jgi:plasmid stabilization system protein ParE
MKPNIRLEFAFDARQDIDDILQYTLDEWGRDQMEWYETVLYDAFRRLCDFPELGPENEHGT